MNLASLVIIEKFSAVIQWFLCHSVILVLRNALNFQFYIWFQVTGWLLTLLGKFVSLLAPPPSTAQPFNYFFFGREGLPLDYTPDHHLDGGRLAIKPSLCFQLSLRLGLCPLILASCGQPTMAKISSLASLMASHIFCLFLPHLMAAPYISSIGEKCSVNR